jgi:hypothetical protein
MGMSGLTDGWSENVGKQSIINQRAQEAAAAAFAILIIASSTSSWIRGCENMNSSFEGTLSFDWKSRHPAVWALVWSDQRLCFLQALRKVLRNDAAASKSIYYVV